MSTSATGPSMTKETRTAPTAPLSVRLEQQLIEELRSTSQETGISIRRLVEAALRYITRQNEAIAEVREANLRAKRALGELVDSPPESS